MTMGLALFQRHALGKADALDPYAHTINRKHLRDYTEMAVGILESGSAAQKLNEYIHITNLYAGHI